MKILQHITSQCSDILSSTASYVSRPSLSYCDKVNPTSTLVFILKLNFIRLFK